MSYAQGSTGDSKLKDPFMFCFSAEEACAALLKSAGLAYATVQGHAFTY